jgi:hypothetical protein
MGTQNSFQTVESIGRTIPGVDVSTSWGQPSLKVRGKMIVCMASHSSAEPHSLVVMMDLADRDAVLQDEPATYYVTPHYVDYPCVLVRLARLDPGALRDLVIGAHRFVSARAKTPATRLRRRPKR